MEQNSSNTLKFDEPILKIATYVDHFEVTSKEALDTATLCLMDSLGCALHALQFSECINLLGPLIEGTVVPRGCRVPGTFYALDPVTAAFNIGTMIRWLDYNDTWLAKEWGHPSDNLGGLLAVSDYICLKGLRLTVKDLLIAMVKAYEIQGIIAQYNSFNRLGLDHVILVKIATAAVATKLLGGDLQAIARAISQAFVDSGPLRTYRHYPNTGPRKSWAAGDQTSRGLWFAFMSAEGEPGYPHALTTPVWGFNATILKGIPLEIPVNLGSYVIENILFKVSFPAEFHAQTAAECAIQLHPSVVHKLDAIKEIQVETQESAMRIINKIGPLNNPADRDHCLQYIIALGLIYGNITAEGYSNATATDPRIDALRKKMVVSENREFSEDYLNPKKRSIANAITIIYQDGTRSKRVEVRYPLGHRNRRSEAIPFIFDKFEQNILTQLNPENSSYIVELFKNRERFETILVSELIDLFIINHF